MRRQKEKLAGPLLRLSFSIPLWPLMQRGGESAERCLCSVISERDKAVEYFCILEVVEALWRVADEGARASALLPLDTVAPTITKFYC